MRPSLLLLALAACTSPHGDDPTDTDDVDTDEIDDTDVDTGDSDSEGGPVDPVDTEVTAGEAPTATIAEPLDDAVVAEGAVVTFRATLADDATAPASLQVAWSSDVDGPLDATPPSAAGVASFDTDALSRGDHAVTLTVTDADGLVGTATVHLVVDGLPTAPQVSIAPASPGTDADLVAVIDVPSDDPDGAPVTYAYAWTRDGAPTAWVTDTVPAAATARDETWAVTVTPHDGRLAGPAATASVVVADTAPTVTGARISPRPAGAGDTLTCETVGWSDADGDAEATTFAWLVDGVAVGTGPTFSGASRGDVVTCVATPSDGTLTTAPVFDSLVVGNTPPVTATPTVSPDAPVRVDTLTCTPGETTDVDGTTDFTFHYAWTVDGVTVPDATAGRLSGAFARGDQVACTVTPDDGSDRGEPQTSAPVTVADAPPAITSVAFDHAVLRAADTLGLTLASSDVDGDLVTYRYAWTVDDAPVPSTAATLSGAFTKGAWVGVTVVPNDGLLDGAPASPAPIRVANTPPTVATVAVGPVPPRSESVLTCTAGGIGDADGDLVSVDYAWTVNGAPAGTGPALSGPFPLGTEVACTATPHDGEDAGAPRTAAVTIENRPPVVTSIAVTPEEPTRGSPLRCEAEITDPDGDAFQVAYTWKVNGVLAGSSQDLTGGLVRDDVVTCEARPYDAHESGVPVRSDPVTIRNSPPSVRTATVTPTEAWASSPLFCDGHDVDDADGDPVTLHYDWQIDDTWLGHVDRLLPPEIARRDQSVRCKVTPDDGRVLGAAVVSEPISIRDTRPRVDTLRLSPQPPTTSAPITCEATASDIDGDPVTLTYAWYLNGSKLSGQTSERLDPSQFARDDLVGCMVTPSAAGVAGATARSLSAKVANAAPTAPVLKLTPSKPRPALDNLVCSVTTPSTDTDADPVSYTFTWTRNGADFAVHSDAATSSTVSGIYVVIHDVWTCTAVPSDGTDDGPSASASVTVPAPFP